MPLRVRVTGAGSVKRAMALNAKKINAAVTAGLFQEAQSVMAESQLIVPRDTGALASSGKVPLPVKAGGTVTVEMRYGDSRVVYARRQHEDLTYRHTAPQTAKYLQIPFLEKLSGLERRMARRVSAALRSNKRAAR